MLAGKAATQKQYDDVKAMVDEGRSALEGQTHQAEVMIAGAKAESAAIALKVDQVNDQIRRCLITNPVSGVVLAKYTEEQELARTRESSLQDRGYEEHVFAGVC